MFLRRMGGLLWQDLARVLRAVSSLLEPEHKRGVWRLSLGMGLFTLFELLVGASVLPFLACLRGDSCGPAGVLGDWLGWPPLLVYACLLLLLLSFKGLAEMWLHWSIAGFQQRVQRSLALRLTHGFLHQGWPSFRARHRADYFKRATTTSLDAAHACKEVLTMMSAALVVVVLTGLMLWVNPLASLSLFAAFLLVSAIAQRWVGRIQSRAAHARERALHRWHVNTAEALASFRELRIYGAEQRFLDEIAADTERLAAANRRIACLPHIPRLALDTIAFALVLSAVLAWLALERPIGELLPHFVFYAVVGRSVLPAMMNFASARTGLRGSVVNVDLVVEDLARARALAESRLPLPIEAGDPGLNLAAVSFAHPGETRRILDAVSLTIRTGEWVALTGPSGAGKSTLFEIVSGIQRPDAGRLAWQVRNPAGDGAPVVAYVPQHVALLDASIADNVVFGFDAGREADVERALRLAQLGGLLATLPDGMRSAVGAEGTRLSGGERARVAIARAIYRQPDLLLLDEATGALDEATERALFRALRAALPQATVLIITHRVGTLDAVDRVLRLEGGRLEEFEAAAGAAGDMSFR